MVGGTPLRGRGVCIFRSQDSLTSRTEAPELV